MIWRPILSHVGPTMVLALIAVAVPSLSLSAQELSTEERLDRLERDLSMLQRQVYGHPGDVPDAGAESGNAADIEIRMERLEQQMRGLTGRVEEVTNQIDRLHQRLEQIDSDVEARLGQGVPPPPPPAAFGPGPMAPHRVPATAGPLPDVEAPSPPEAPPPPGAPAPEPGTLTPPMPLLPHANSGNSDVPSPPQGGTLPSGSASAQYNFAFGLLKEADYPAAEEALRAFLRQHPGSALAGNAQFWLGETYYARGRYREAASAFAEGYRRYPKGPKAADDLLQLGMSLARGGDHHNACLAFAQLDHAFPHSRGAVKERAAAEKQRLGCGS
jgi:tol-pal system protein YbgF